MMSVGCLESCVICKSPSTPLTSTSRGIQTLIDYSKRINDDELTNLLEEKSSTGQHVKVHRECQKKAYNTKRKTFKEDRSPELTKKTRSSNSHFSFMVHCLYCGEEALVDKKNPKRNPVGYVNTLPFKDQVLDVCNQRQDDWAEEVRRSAMSCNDLIAAEARYHYSCNKRFTAGLQKVAKQSTRAGRPVLEENNDAFNLLCEWLETEAEPYSLNELHEKMIALAGTDDVYTPKWLKARLKERYQDHVYFSEVNGKSNVVCFENIAHYLLCDTWYNSRKDTIEGEAERIIQTAAKIILNDIRSTNYQCENYPSDEEIANIEKGSEWLPKYLHLLMKIVVKSKTKAVSIGQAIVQINRQRSCIAPVPFALAVQMDHVFGSKWLITQLHRLGFCVGYDEVTRYKQSVLVNEEIADILKTYLPGSFTQWMADNVDHNPATLDGKGSLHAMGIISATTAQDALGVATSFTMPAVPRKKHEKVADVTKDKGVPIMHYVNHEETGISKITFKELPTLEPSHVIPTIYYLNVLWHSSHFVLQNSRPNWSGFMSKTVLGEHPGKATVSFLPILDLNPNDMTCVYYVLLFVQNQARQLGIPTPVITFDQPLWLKAMEIINAKSLHIVTILGGFHLLMSYLGSLGALMKGSVLAHVLEEIYGANAVKHVMSGKAISRALRAHVLVGSALTVKLLKQVIPSEEQPESAQSKLSKSEMEKVEALLDTVASQPMSAKIEQYNVLYILDEKLKGVMNDLSSQSRTAKYWCQYLRYVELMKDYITAEKTGDWHLHLANVRRMTTLFAATAHINYAKSARLYLQTMMELPENYPWVYEQFSRFGLHTVRRSDKIWGGLWSDLIIEQVLMRSLKSRGGITRGRGVTESVRVILINTMHRCASVHNAASDFTNLLLRTSEQHVELSNSRIERDNQDHTQLLSWFDAHEPFDFEEPLLKSPSTGVVASAEDGVNCDDAENVGEKIQASLDGICVEKAVIKRNSQVKTLEDLLPGVNIQGKKINIDPTILFTRLIALAQSDENIQDHFAYELTHEPTVLFKDGLMRKPQKSKLRQYLLNKRPSIITNEIEVCVVDGGALLHKVKWKAKVTYRDVCQQYLEFVKRIYGKYATVCVVFDGYNAESASIKAHEHQRRHDGFCIDVQVSPDIEVTTSSERFLLNGNNKQQFITLLCTVLEANGYSTQQSEGDADVLIVETALEYCSSQNVVVLADDTDILIMLMYHMRPEYNDMYFGTSVREEAKLGKKLATWKIKDLCEVEDMTSYLLFAHAWTGCDTTSAIHNKGKTKILQMLKQSEELRETISCFGMLESTQEEVAKAGYKVFISNFNGKKSDTLTSLRYASFMLMVSKCSQLQPENLPPTERAAFYHSLRVHLQVCQWKELQLDVLDAAKWGWNLVDKCLVPVKTDQPCAPDWLMQFIHCNCKLSSKNQCGTRLCTCRKNGLSCVQACGDCRGESCNNSDMDAGNICDDSNEENDFEENL